MEDGAAQVCSQPVLSSKDHRVGFIIGYIKDHFETHEYDRLLLHILHQKAIKTHVDNVVVATGIWQNLRQFAKQHIKQMGVHTWKLLQAVTSVLHLPGHHLSTAKLARITRISAHHFSKGVDVVCKEANAADRSGTRNPHAHKIEPWVLETMMPSPHSAVLQLLIV